ncbi:SDR family NAD(P)-dependent oxidoreductase [Jannaschia sp. Os4]|uniref:SDR family oxidoreductase n=1 Tax=Jannaschia sp. Os4 TaxID=2807617 RepID=UPI00193AD789|nr:SDR family oxidoreductase [Jannaschia sp. Os4]MBM2576029.1 SDR family NAD(P)-dependent oxidoreductase [Jannaschia sp. Os4]
MSKIAVVAGGSAGVGRAVVDMMLDRGWRVAVLARGKERLDEIEAQYGDRVWTRACDVAEWPQVEKAASDLVAHWGKPDVWVNSAMLTVISPFKDMTDAEFRRVTEGTYLGTVNGVRAALQHMERGNVVNVGSALSYRGLPWQSAYVGAKHAVNGFTQSVRSELIRQGRPIEIGLVQLPAVNTPQFDWARNRMDNKPQPAEPIYQPEVAARGVMKAIDDDCREVLVGRAAVQLVFGNMLAPDYFDRMLAENGVEMQRSDQTDWGRGDNLETPLSDYPSRAHGSFDHKAEVQGMAVDADATRKALAIGGAALLFGLGALVGRSAAPSPRRRVARREAPVAVEETGARWGYTDHARETLARHDRAAGH